jgi:VanZ family protein
MSSVFALWGPVALCMAAIFFASSLSHPPMPREVPDVSLHALAYFGLALLVIRALAHARWERVTPARLLAAVILTVLYGVSDEWHQSFVPSRHADVRDLIADAFGACAAAVSVWAWGIIRRL